MTALLLPTSELVAAGWIALALGVGSSTVGPTLPQDESKWCQTGFIQVSGVVGGTPDPEVPLRHPAVSIDCWGVNGTQAAPGATFNASNKPPWNRTAQLAEQIVNGAQAVRYNGATRQVAMLVAGFAHATVHSVTVLTEPRRMLGDTASYARHHLDLLISWTPQEV